MIRYRSIRVPLRNFDLLLAGVRGFRHCVGFKRTD